jgi:hypothetical protein
VRRPEPVASLSPFMDSSQILSRAFALLLTNSKRTGVGRIVGQPEAIQKRAWGKSFADLLGADFWPGTDWFAAHSILNECKRLWLLKNSVFAPNRQNWGDRKCLGDPRKSLVGLPNAILFLRVSPAGVFQQPRLISTTDLTNSANILASMLRAVSIGLKGRWSNAG